MAKAKKALVKQTEEILEEVVENKEITGYLVPILFKREPIDKDIHVADLIYNRWSNSMKLQCFRPNYEADLDTIVAGDISMFTPAGEMTIVSKSEAPVSWVQNLTNSREFSGNPFIAFEAQALYEI
tara:strand:- start:618 stop:995 length:378 start_codon:yes stop_codon:yes gene_type:complete